MATAQAHRGPDGSGTWRAPRVALGHRRLKIIDVSDAGAQPMTTPDGRFTIVYNGEVYNYCELRRELHGVEFRSESDTEVVLQAYAQWGADALERFVGMFALAIWDAERGELFCARDRLGIKPFHYAVHDGDFVFASELRGLCAAGVELEPNPSVLYDFLARDFYDHTDETFFTGIRKLPPATHLTVTASGVGTPSRYWDLAREAAAIELANDRHERAEHLLSLMRDAVDVHLRSDVPVGVALSGGLDSSALLALLDTVHPDPSQVEAFSFVADDKRYSERPFIEAMVEATGRKAHFVDFGPEDFIAGARPVAGQQEEPYAGAPIVAYSQCFQAASDAGFVVMMDGSGVDEALAGYERFRPAYWADLMARGDDEELDQQLLKCDLTTEPNRATALVAAKRVANGTTEGLAQDLTASVRPDCLSDEFVEEAARPAPVFEEPFPDHLRNLMYRELRYTKLPRALRFRDRLSMAVGSELRPPFLDHRVLAYAFALPPEDLIQGQIGKVLLRDALAREIPDAVRRASKRSVQTPQREWFRDELADWVRASIEEGQLWDRGILDERRSRLAMEGYLAGQGDNSFFLWQWINLGHWLADSKQISPGSCRRHGHLVTRQPCHG